MFAVAVAAVCCIVLGRSLSLVVAPSGQPKDAWVLLVQLGLSQIV